MGDTMTMMVQSAESFASDQEAVEKLLTELSGTKKQLNRVTSQNTIMQGMLSKHLDSIEAAFDSDEKFVSPEHAQDYLDSAIWMRGNYGRKDEGRIDRIQYWLDHYLPFGS